MATILGEIKEASIVRALEELIRRIETLTTDAYQQGFEAGQREGYHEGYEDAVDDFYDSRPDPEPYDSDDWEVKS